MKKIYACLHRTALSVFLCTFFLFGFAEKKQHGEFYRLTVYHFKDGSQEKVLDNYLQSALLPALHRRGFEKIGVFKPLANDTAADKLVYVLIAFKAVQQIAELPGQLLTDNGYVTAGKEYIDAVYKAPSYNRMENIILHAFRLALQMQMPQLSSSPSEKIYELRSYESATEKIFQNKVTMFNEGGEIPLFKRLGFNAVFYAEVIAGSHQPNLMYMTSFENMQQHDAHWKAFVDDPEWKKLSADPVYQNNVSHIDITLMHATAYSDY